MIDKWDERFLALADFVSAWSKDSSRMIGAVIVKPETHRIVAMGYNGLPRGVSDDREAYPNRHEHPDKGFYAEHAERNAIYNAREPVEGCTIYVPWFPCARCARAIIQTGIARVVCASTALGGIRPEDEARYGFSHAETMLREAGVIVEDAGWIG